MAAAMVGGGDVLGEWGGCRGTWHGEESSSAREEGRRGVWAQRVGDHGKQEVAGVLHGGGRCSAPTALKQREIGWR